MRMAPATLCARPLGRLDPPRAHPGNTTCTRPIPLLLPRLTAPVCMSGARQPKRGSRPGHSSVRTGVPGMPMRLNGILLSFALLLVTTSANSMAYGQNVNMSRADEYDAATHDHAHGRNLNHVCDTGSCQDNLRDCATNCCLDSTKSCSGGKQVRDRGWAWRGACYCNIYDCCAIHSPPPRPPPPPPPLPVVQTTGRGSNSAPLQGVGTQAANTNEDGGSGVGAAVGGAVGGMVVLAIIIGLVVYMKKKNGNTSNNANNANNSNAAVVATPVAVTVEMKAEPEPVVGVAKKNPFSLKLEELGCGQYESALADQGYDSVASLQGLTKEEAGAIADDVKMKPGHKKRFVAGLVN